MDHQQRLFDIIAILTKKLGGKVTITASELTNPPKGTVQREVNGTMILTVDKQ